MKISLAQILATAAIIDSASALFFLPAPSIKVCWTIPLFALFGAKPKCPGAAGSGTGAGAGGSGASTQTDCNTCKKNCRTPPNAKDVLNYYEDCQMQGGRAKWDADGVYLGC